MRRYGVLTSILAAVQAEVSPAKLKAAATITRSKSESSLRAALTALPCSFCPGSAVESKRLILRQQPIGFLQLGGAGVVRFLRLSQKVLQVLPGYVLLAGLRGGYAGAVHGIEAARECL